MSPLTQTSQTTERLLEFVRRTFRPSSAVGPASALFSSGLIDSLGLVELLAFVHQAFGVSLELSVEEFTKLDTAEQLAALIGRLKDQGSA